MKFDRRTILFAGAGALGTLSSGQAWAQAGTRLSGVLVQASSQIARVTLALTGPAQPHTFFLRQPDRFVVDLPGARLTAADRAAGGGLVQRCRLAQHPGYVRVVVDLEAPATLVREARGARGAPELAYDLAPAAPFPAPPPPLERRGRSASERMIVIDAGHGGRDPGAIGVTGVREKDVVLDAALKLRDALQHRGGYSVALTRDTDRFVELDARVQFARERRAALFISLHADSHASREALGASVYTLSENGAARAQSVMAAQNWSVDFGHAGDDSVVSGILLDLAQRETTNRSAQFAQTVIPRLGQVAPLLRNTHRSAGYFVLLAPDVPAVLIETGFLSNVADERRLANPGERERMAEAMAGAVDAYFAAPQHYAARA